MAGGAAARARPGRARRRQPLARDDRRRVDRPRRSARPGHLPARPVRRAPRPGARRPPDRPDPAAGRRPARRDLAAADAAPAPGPRHAGRLRDDPRARPGPAGLAGPGDRDPRHARDRRPLGCLAAALQVHVGGDRRRAAAAHVRVRHRRQRLAPHALDRAGQRPAVGAAQGDPRRLPRRLPVGEPAAPDGAGHEGRTAAAAAGAVPRRRWSRCGRSPSASWSSSATSARRCSSSACSWRSLYVATGRVSLVVDRAHPVRPRQPADGAALRPRPDPHRRLGRPVRRPARHRLPGRPGAPRLRPRRPGRRRPRGRPAGDQRPPPDPRDPHGLPARGARRGARHRRASSPILGPVPRGRRARAPDRRGRRGRLPLAARDRALAGHRDPGVHHRGRQPQGPAADRRDAAVHQLRRLVAARERASSSGSCSRCPTRASSHRRRRRRSATAGVASSPGGGADADVRRGRAIPARRGPSSTSRSCSSLAFGALAGAAGYWGVVARRPSWRVARTTRRSSPRPGRCRAAAILDRDGKVLARNAKRRQRRALPRLRERRGQPGRRLRVAPLRPGRARADATTPSCPGCRRRPARRTSCASSGPTRTTRRT